MLCGKSYLTNCIYLECALGAISVACRVFNRRVSCCHYFSFDIDQYLFNYISVSIRSAPTCCCCQFTISIIFLNTFKISKQSIFKFPLFTD